jgi:hypothetical protein
LFHAGSGSRVRARFVTGSIVMHEHLLEGLLAVLKQGHGAPPGHGASRLSPMASYTKPMFA